MEEPPVMKQYLFATLIALSFVVPSVASANPEPTAYDSRSTAMGLTGTSYLERPAAVAINPANLEGIDKFGFTVNFSALLVNQWAPVEGPNTRLESGLGFGPLPAGFIAARIAPRVVFGAGIYIETGYGSDFSDVRCLDGDVVGPPPNYEPATLNSTPQCTNADPQDLNVSFFVGEFSAGTSIRVTDNFWLGVTLRLPFSKQVADLYQNVGAALGFVSYDRVKNDLGGVGFPSPRFGFTWKPHKKVSIGAMYRMYSKIKLTGTTQSALITGIIGEDSLNSQANWFIPHAIQAGIAIFPNERVVVAIEGRAQFHGANKSGNKTQTVIVETPPDSQIEIAPIVVPFGWRNAWSVKVGAEYRFPIDMLLIRGGANFARSATSGEFAQYFTPPPGYSGFLSAGLGFYFDGRGGDQKDMYLLDLAGAFAFSVGSIGDQFIDQPATIPGTNDQTVLCSDQQVVRTGCPGDLGVYTYFLTLGFTVQY
ncbi:MAG: outer membrane protein transport protein [Myxococcota bacterium]